MRYRERNDECRNIFQQQIATIDPATVVYVDECGVVEGLQRAYGYCKKGDRLAGECNGNRGQRHSIIAGWCTGKVLAPWIYTGTCDTSLVAQWLKEGLIPQLKAGMTVVWDNATFHKRQDLQQAIEAAGCWLVFLPTYSPDLNPIEHLWAELKAWIRRMLCPLIPFDKLLDAFFQQSNKIFT
jgi:hypothetical protein